MNELELFEMKVANLDVYGTVERNTFNLVRKYLKGKYDEDNSEITSEFAEKAIASSIYYGEDIDINDILIHDIEARLNHIKDLININQYNLLVRKLKELKVACWDLEADCRARDREIEDANKREKNKIEKRYEAMIDEANTVIDYSIIELNAALGLSVEIYSNSKIRNFCGAIAFDVNNDKYETLTFNEHIRADGSIDDNKLKQKRVQF